MGAGELEIIAPLIIAVILTLTVGGVILLKPITNKLGSLLEAMAKEKSQSPQITPELERMHDILETISGRLALLEERQDFTDALLADPERRRARLERGKAEE